MAVLVGCLILSAALFALMFVIVYQAKKAKGIIIDGLLSEIDRLKKELDKYPGLVGRDIVKHVTTKKSYRWESGVDDVFSDKPVKPKKKFKVTVRRRKKRKPKCQ